MAYRLFVSAGEASGDRHAAAVIRELRRRVGEVEVRGLGGSALAAEGAELMARVEDLSVLGFAEVARRLPFFFRLERRVRHMVRSWRPHVVLPVDYPGFNLRLGRAARREGSRVVYYIAPQVWAWRRERRPGIARAVDRLLVVFPFEKPLFEEAGISTTFVGHPLLDTLSTAPRRTDARRRLGADNGRPVLALLPGSRPQEVARILPALLAGTRSLSEEGVQVVVSRAPGLADALFAPAVSAGASVWSEPAAGLLRAADAALVASGTATLETGLHGVPLAVVYRTGGINWALARRLVALRTVGLVNIAAGGDRVPELLQGDCSPEKIQVVARRILFDARERSEQKEYLVRLRDRLGEAGAAARVADVLARELRREPAP